MSEPAATVAALSGGIIAKKSAKATHATTKVATANATAKADSVKKAKEVKKVSRKKAKK